MWAVLDQLSIQIGKVMSKLYMSKPQRLRSANRRLHPAPCTVHDYRTLCLCMFIKML